MVLRGVSTIQPLWRQVFHDLLYLLQELRPARQIPHGPKTKPRLCGFYGRLIIFTLTALGSLDAVTQSSAHTYVTFDKTCC